MTYDRELYQDFGDGPQRPFTLHDVSIEGDGNFAGRDLYIQHIVAGLSLLRQHPVSRQSIPDDSIFVSPKFLPGELSADLPVDDVLGSGVLGLVGAESSGRRTSALVLLSEALNDSRRKIFELYPDWEQPDAQRIPREANTGYLLNLTGVREQLSAQFHEQLADYAMHTRTTGTHLIIVATSHVWNRPAVNSLASPVRTLMTTRPSSVTIATRRIAASPGLADRTAWLTEPGMFSGLLRDGEPPAEGVRLAEIVLTATGINDAEARDRFLGWEHKLGEWFGGSEPDAPERRALQIAAAFLDGSKARTVLDAADELLAQPAVNWPVRQGGPLAGANDSERCAAADLAFSADGTVSVNTLRPGIDRALLQHVWRKRPQLVPILTRWISSISKPAGAAEDSLGRLAATLTAVAESEDAQVVLDLAHQWLLTGLSRHVELAVSLVDQLAVHPELGPSVRKELAAWAKGLTAPERQRAVAAVCARELGKQYPSIALTRLKYVLDKARDNGVRASATATLKKMLIDPDVSARALSSMVEWAAASDSEAPSRTAFLDVFGGSDAVHPGTPAHVLLSIESEQGEAVRRMLRDGWRAIWRRAELRAQASDVLGAWCDAVGREGLPADQVEETVAVIFKEHADALGDDLDKVIGGADAFRSRLRTRYVDVVRETTARRAASDTDHSV